MATSMEDGRSKVKNKLHQMFNILQLNLNSDDVERFKTQMLISGTVGDFWKRKNQSHIPRKLYKYDCDAVTFLKFLESKGHIDETNTNIVQDTIRSVRPELYELTSTETYDAVEVDPVVAYLEETAPLQPKDFFNLSSLFEVPVRRSERLKRKRQEETDSPKNDRRMKKAKTKQVEEDQLCISQPTSLTSSPVHLEQIHSCDVRLRVKVEYVDHQEVLGNSVHSHKRHEIERQFEKFSQASTILKSRDLGTVVCDIKFSELTSLDAFWRDYTNGALLEALKVVFITESLNEAVGHEPLRLLVSVDEDDFRKGRLKLLKNLTH